MCTAKSLWISLSQIPIRRSYKQGVLEKIKQLAYWTKHNERCVHNFSSTPLHHCWNIKSSEKLMSKNTLVNDAVMFCSVCIQLHDHLRDHWDWMLFHLLLHSFLLHFPSAQMFNFPSGIIKVFLILIVILRKRCDWMTSPLPVSHPKSRNSSDQWCPGHSHSAEVQIFLLLIKSALKKKLLHYLKCLHKINVSNYIDFMS